MSDASDALLSAIAKSVKHVKETKARYDAKLQERITLQLKVDEYYSQHLAAKKELDDYLKALEAIV